MGENRWVAQKEQHLHYLPTLGKDYNSHKALGHVQPLPRGLHLRVSPLGAI